MARAALKMTMHDLVKQVGTSTVTVVKLEAGGRVADCIVEQILKVLEDGGIEFINETRRQGPGVRLVKKPKVRNRKEAGRKGAITRLRNRRLKELALKQSTCRGVF